MKKLFSFFSLILITLIFSVKSKAFYIDSEYGITIKVGIVLQDGLAEKDEDGNFYGYTIDYLENLRKYSYVNFEYIEITGGSENEQIIKSYQMLEDGEIDLLGATNYYDSIADRYLFAENPYGYSSTTLSCLTTNDKYSYNEPETLNGITIGYCLKSQERYNQFVSYAKTYGISFNEKLYSSFTEVIEACYKGEIDATFFSNLYYEPGFKKLAEISSRGFFFVTQKDNYDVMVPVNLAMKTLDSIKPTLKDDLHCKYFDEKHSFSMSKDELEFINDINNIRIGFFTDLRPLSYLENGELKGLLVDSLSLLLESINIKYTIVLIENYDDMVDKSKNNEIDLIYGLPDYITLPSDIKYRMTPPIYNETSILVSSKLNKEEKSSLSILSDIENKLLGQYSLVMPSSTANIYFKQHKLYSKIDANLIYYGTTDYNIIDLSENNQLLRIIDRYIFSTSQTLDSTSYMTNIHYSLVELLEIYVLEIVVLTIVIIAALFFFVSIYYLRKSKEIEAQNILNSRYKFILDKIRDFIFDYHFDDDLFEYRRSMDNKTSYIKNFTMTNDFRDILPLLTTDQTFNENIRLDLGEGLKWYHVNTNFVYDSKGNIISLLGALEDIDHEIIKEEDLRYKANYDMLSNILNRHGLVEAIKNNFSQTSVGVCLSMDLDNFKMVNDTLGHQEGDKLIVQFAKFLSEQFSEEVVSRFSGDEFIVLIKGEYAKESIFERLNVFIQVAHEKVFKEYENLGVSVSIGAYIFSDINNFKLIYALADKALYDAKMKKDSFVITSYDD